MNHGKTQLRTGLILASVIAGLAVLSLFWTPWDINQMDTLSRMQPPSLRHLFGTDNMGRDVFSRAIVGGRFTLAVALSLMKSSCALSMRSARFRDF